MTTVSQTETPASTSARPAAHLPTDPTVNRPRHTSGPDAITASTPAEDAVDTSDSRGAKRKRLSRSKTSCFKCRARKAKCGALPPDTCPYCLKNGLECVWPLEDGRSLRHLHLQDGRSMNGTIGGRVEVDLVGTTAVVEESTDLSTRGRYPESERQNDALAIWDDFVDASSSSAPPARLPTHDGLVESGTSRQLHDHGSTNEGDANSGRFPETNWRSWLVPSTTGSPRNPFGNDTFSLDMTTSDPTMRSLFGSTGDTDVQLQLVLQGYSSGVNDETSQRATRPEDHPFWPFDFPSASASDPSGSTAPARPAGSGIMHIKYLRSHGRTAFVPGTLAIPIKIQLSHSPIARRIESSIAPSPDLTSCAAPPEVLKHLIDVFQTYLSPQYPCVDCAELRASVDTDAAPSFLLNCVAAASARFSTDPRVASTSLKPESHGDVYYERANAMLGSVMRLPLRETVIGCALLASYSVTGQWMMTGAATRMAIDLGLHRIDPGSTDPATARANRLTFWTIVLIDYMVALGVGRTTSLRPESITQPPPTLEDMQTADPGQRPLRSPFVYAAQMMCAYGPLINVLNSEDTKPLAPGAMADIVRKERVSIMRQYQQLPTDMHWSPDNLRAHNASGQGAMYLHIHMWVHTMLSNSILPPVDSNDLADGRSMAGFATPVDQLSRSGAKMITEYLSLCAMVDPAIYYTHSFIGQPLFTAGLVIINEMRRHERGVPVDNADCPSELDMTSSILTSFAHSQIDVIKKAISEICVYWRGASLVRTALDRCIQAGGRRLGGESDVGMGPNEIWKENEDYAVEVYDWTLPRRYRADGVQVN